MRYIRVPKAKSTMDIEPSVGCSMMAYVYIQPPFLLMHAS